MRRLIDSLQHTTEDNDDDEMQLAFQAAQQFETGQHRSPNYVALASQHGSRSLVSDISDVNSLHLAWGLPQMVYICRSNVDGGTGIDNSPH